MKRFVEGDDRKQVTLLPECLDDFVAEDNPVRNIDAFIKGLELTPRPARSTSGSSRSKRAFSAIRRRWKLPTGPNRSSWKQRSSGRKESSLHRGLDHHGRRFVEPVL